MRDSRAAVRSLVAVVVALSGGCGSDDDPGASRSRGDGGPVDAGAGDAGPGDSATDVGVDAGPCVDLDGDGAGTSGACPFDCDDADRSRPGPEECDGIDQDCDGEIDDGLPHCWASCADADLCDPDCGFVGGPCRNDRQCEVESPGGARLQLSCLDEQQFGLPGGYCAAIPSLAAPHACEPDDDATCPADQRGVCLVDERSDVASCLRSCSLTDETWAGSNCGCREGFACELSGGYCTPGCSVARQAEDCCRRWEDSNADGYPTANELVDIPDCDSLCDPLTFRCTNPGSDGAAIGDECLSKLDCPANGDCLGDARPPPAQHCVQSCGGGPGPLTSWNGGYCSIVSCELEGRQCPGQSSCIHVSGSIPRTLCLGTCTVADSAVIDPFVDPNPACRDGYRCLAVPELAGAASCADDADCVEGVPCRGGLCGGDGVCIPVAPPRSAAVRSCDTAVFSGTGCPGDDRATARWNETQRCVDGLCQPPCDGAHPCDIDDDGESDTACVEGYCRWSVLGGPCLDPDARQPNDLGCVSPYGQGRCLSHGIWSEIGTCVLESCAAAGMDAFCREGQRCIDPTLLPSRSRASHGLAVDFGPFPSLPTVTFTPTSLCVDSCTVAAADCVGAADCQGEAVGCRAGFACVDLGDGADEGVCLASCSEGTDQAGDPDSFCETVFELGHCALDRGVCEP